MKLNNVLASLLLASVLVSCEKVKLNKVPVSDAGPAQTIQAPVDSLTLTGTGTDSDGSITGYLWSKVSGPNIPAIHTPGSATTKVAGLIAGTYKFQLMVVDNEGATGLDTVSVNVLPATAKTLSLQPGLNDGQDCFVIVRQGDPAISNANSGQALDMPCTQWTYNALGFGEGTIRSYIKFTGLSVIPANADISSAKLSLYGVASSTTTPVGNSHYPGSPYGVNPDNPFWIKPVTANWDESTLTWNNKPGTSDLNQVLAPGTTKQWNNNFIDIDVTEMVRKMILTNTNYGFCLQLQNEAIYRNVTLSTSEATDASLRPKLVVVYR
jgi:hypothetical protein